jgi:uncharacterized protein involved in response to NO
MQTILDENFTPPKETLVYKPVVVVIWLLVWACGVVLRFMHWPGSSILILCGSGILSGYMLTVFRNPKGRQPFTWVIAILCGLWCFFMLLGFFPEYRPAYYYTEVGFALYGASFLLSFCLQEVLNSWRKKKASAIEEPNQPSETAV